MAQDQIPSLPTPSPQPTVPSLYIIDAVAVLSMIFLVVNETLQQYWQSLKLVQTVEGKREPSRETASSFLSRITYSWFDPLLVKAQEKPLEEEDVWELDPSDQSEAVLKVFEPIHSLSSIIDGYVYFLARRLAVRVRTVLVSLVYEKALRRACGVGGGAGGGKGKGKEKMGGKDEEKASVGKIVTIMSTDTEKVVNIIFGLQRPLLILPLNIVIAITFLMQILGPSALAGLGVVLLSGPLAGLVSSGMMRNQQALSAATDRRTAVTNEAFQGIKIIKYFGWEPHFIKRIREARETELSKIIQLWIYYIGLYLIAFSGSVLVIFVSFFFYSVIAGHTLDAATAFTSITLLKRLSIFLNVLPMVAMHVLSGKVAFDRIANFLKEEELEKYGNPSSSTDNDNPAVTSIDETTPLLGAGATAARRDKGKTAMTESTSTDLANTTTLGFDSAKFIYFGTDAEKKVKPTQVRREQSWFRRKPSPAPTAVGNEEGGEQESARQMFELRNATVEFPKGLLSVIVGPTGAGKTSLVLALLGG
ncbi:hypothetical protein HDU67_007572 [Dinochytrium kinnereticum]|nr:hypothetical protein HDU67_007572 [Dinochytrium kinnereticum]